MSKRFVDYAEIHRKVTQKILNEQVVKQYKEDAALLENFFRYVKKVSLKVETEDQTGLETAAFRAVMAAMKNQQGKNLFDWTRLLESGGLKFEHSIARLATYAEEILKKNIKQDENIKKDIENNVKINIGTSLSVGAREVGKKQANIQANSSIKVDEQIKKEIEKNVNEKVKNLFGSQFLNSGTVASVEGKIDIQGNKSITVQIRGNGKLDMPQRILYLLASSNFSLKNYSSLRKKETGYIPQATTAISLGGTTLYRALYSILNFGGIKDIDEVILAMMHDVSRKNASKEKRNHLYHLRYMYELTGAGLVYADGSDHGIVDFFIYNDPHTNSISVKSSAEMIENELKAADKYSSALVKNINMTRVNEQDVYYRQYAGYGIPLNILTN